VTKIELSFDEASCSADAIQRAAYRFSDRLTLDFVRDGGVYRCTAHLPIDDRSSADAIVADFKVEVLDQVLRERIRDQTAGVRNVILALAFTNTGLSEEA
jgi:His-Xaa-Ser system protein HxsD